MAINKEEQKAIEDIVNAVLEGKLLDKRLEVMEEAIDKLNKKVDDTADSVIVKKPKKPTPPREFEVSGKSYRAKGNKFRKLNEETGSTDLVDLTDLKEADLKKVYKDHPNMFIEV